jgi:MFS family permease
VVLSLGSVPLGVLADRVSRKLVISSGVIFWSFATFLSGFAISYRMLLMARALVGVGEAAYTPAGTAMISATFSKRVRARVQGIFDAAMFLGGAVGIALGGIMATWAGWRAAFLIVGVPGLILGLLSLRLPDDASLRKAELDTQHETLSEALPETQSDSRFSLAALLRRRAYLLILISGWFSAFAGYSYIAWGPEFVQDYLHFTAREAGIALGSIVILAGVCGVLSGAFLADRFASRYAWGRAIIVPAGFIVAAPFIYLSLHSLTKMSFTVFFGIGTFFLTWYHGPVTATIHDIVPPSGHASAMGFYSFFVNLFSMAVAPMLIGRLADRAGLLPALHIALVAQILGAVFFVMAILEMKRDMSRGQAGAEQILAPANRE